MSASPVADLVSAGALVLVIEGLAIALMSSRVEGLLEQLRALDPEQLRWGGLGMAVLGCVVYLLVRS
ncbi:MAG: DUF2065 domain-containing protein [Pikeienuella sp.]